MSRRMPFTISVVQTMKNILLAAGVAMATLSGAAVQAATISITSFDGSGFAAATAGATIEDFESYRSKRWISSTRTAVGSFSSMGGTGSGSVCGNNNDGIARCNGLGIQIGSDSGQGNLWPASGMTALSSNDTFGIIWDVFLAGNAAFDSVVFGLRDAADVRGTVFTISAGGETRELRAQADNNEKLVRIDFGRSLTNATVQMFNTNAKGGMKANDGFTIDGAAVNVTPVPLPAGMVLLLGGVAALGAMRARKKAA